MLNFHFRFLFSILNSFFDKRNYLIPNKVPFVKLKVSAVSSAPQWPFSGWQKIDRNQEPISRAPTL